MLVVLYFLLSYKWLFLIFACVFLFLLFFMKYRCVSLRWFKFFVVLCFVVIVFCLGVFSVECMWSGLDCHVEYGVIRGVFMNTHDGYGFLYNHEGVLAHGNETGFVLFHGVPVSVSDIGDLHITKFKNDDIHGFVTGDIVTVLVAKKCPRNKTCLTLPCDDSYNISCFSDLDIWSVLLFGKSGISTDFDIDEMWDDSLMYGTMNGFDSQFAYGKFCYESIVR